MLSAVAHFVQGVVLFLAVAGVVGFLVIFVLEKSRRRRDPILAAARPTSKEALVAGLLCLLVAILCGLFPFTGATYSGIGLALAVFVFYS